MRSKILISVYLMANAAAFATDRVVGPTSLYNTISVAIAASSDGDRILVEAGTYNEYLTISKSLTVQAQLEGGRFNVLRGVRIDTAVGRTIMLSGIRTTTIEVTGAYAPGTVLRVVDSRFERCDASGPRIRVELYRDSVVNNIVVSSCSVYGCTFGSNTPSYTGVVFLGPTALSDRCDIVGNSFGTPEAESLIGLSTSSEFHFENNFVRMAAASTINVVRSHNMNGPASSIINNTFYLVYPLGQHQIALVDSGLTDMITTRNNVTIGWNQLFGPVPPSTVLDAAYNVYGAPTWINTSTGQPTNGSPLIDAGDPDPRYLDLDLTRNDAGCFGGSNSRANFITGMGSAVVGFMQAPRVVAQNQPVIINAVGFDR